MSITFWVKQLDFIGGVILDNRVSLKYDDFGYAIIYNSVGEIFFMAHDGNSDACNHN